MIQSERAYLRRAPLGSFTYEEGRIPKLTKTQLLIFSRAYVLTLAALKYPDPESWIKWAFHGDKAAQMEDRFYNNKAFQVGSTDSKLSLDFTAKQSQATARQGGHSRQL